MATQDREGIQEKLKDLIHPLDLSQIDYHKALINIYTGKLADDECNLPNATAIGMNQYEEFKKGLPDNFYCTIPHMDNKKSKESTSTTLIDPGLIYSRAIVLLQTDHPNAMKIENILAYELAVFPPATRVASAGHVCTFIITVNLYWNLLIILYKLKIIW